MSLVEDDKIRQDKVEDGRADCSEVCQVSVDIASPTTAFNFDHDSSPIHFTPPTDKTVGTIKERQRTAFVVLSNIHPDKCRTCVSLLEIIYQRSYVVSLNHDALQLFISNQFRSCSRTLIKKFDLQMLTKRDLAEDMENLGGLFDDVCVGYPNCAKPLVSSLKLFITAVSDVYNELEKIIGCGATDFVALAEAYAEKGRQIVTGFDVHYETYIPSLKHFVINRRITQGNYSDILEVVHKQSNHTLALKITTVMKFKQRGPEQQELMYVDKAVCAVMSDNNLCPVLCCFQLANDLHASLFPTYEKCVDLHNYLDSHPHIPEVFIGPLVIQLFLAIEVLHIKGFIHRDIRPSNVLLEVNGHIKLTDYDSAKICRGLFSRNGHLRYFKLTAGEFPFEASTGSVAFLAPESVLRKSFGRASDWWSFGVLIYKAVTNILPFRGSTAEETRRSIVDNELRWPKAELTPHVATATIKELIYDVLQKRPGRRLGSISYNEFRKHKTIQQYLTNLAPGDDARSCTPREKVRLIEMFYDFSPQKTKRRRSQIGLSIASPIASPILSPKLESKETFDFNDLPKNQRSPLMWFISRRYIKFMDRLKSKSTFETSDTFFMQRLTPDKEPNYNINADEGGEISETIHDTQRQRKALNHVTEVSMTYKKSFMLFKSSQVQFDVVFGDGKVSFPIVTETSENPKNDLTKLIQWDIIISVERTPVVNMPISDFNNLIKSQMKNPPGVIKLSVLTLGIFRMIQSRGDTVYETIAESPKVPITVVSRCKTQFFRTRCRRLYHSKKDAPMQLNIVVFTDPSISILEGKSLLFGDVVVEVNGQLMERIPEHRLPKILNPLKNRLTILETSILRRNDLIETAVSPRITKSPIR